MNFDFVTFASQFLNFCVQVGRFTSAIWHGQLSIDKKGGVLAQSFAIPGKEGK